MWRPTLGLHSAFDRDTFKNFLTIMEMLTYSELIDKADDALFGQVIKNPGHVLQPLLPDWTKAQTSIMKTF